MYIHFKLNLTVFLSTSINASDEDNKDNNCEIIKNQINDAFDKIVQQQSGYPKEQAEIVFEEDAVFNLEIGRDGELQFQVLHCTNSVITTTIDNAINPYRQYWRECRPAPWKESIKFKKTIAFVLALEEEYILCLN